MEYLVSCDPQEEAGIIADDSGFHAKGVIVITRPVETRREDHSDQPGYLSIVLSIFARDSIPFKKSASMDVVY